MHIDVFCNIKISKYKCAYILLSLIIVSPTMSEYDYSNNILIDILRKMWYSINSYNVN